MFAFKFFTFALLSSILVKATDRSFMEQRQLIQEMFQVRINPSDGWKPTNFEYTIQYPFDLKESDRYTPFKNGHYLWVKNTDKPHTKISHTHPRTELAMKKGYDSGNHQIQCDFYIPKGTNGVNIFQIFGGDDKYATSLMLRVSNGKLTVYSDTVIVNDLYDQWHRLNVIHYTDSGKILIYINGNLKATYQDKGKIRHNFKLGVYAMDGASHIMESYFKNIKTFEK